MQSPVMHKSPEKMFEISLRLVNELLRIAGGQAPTIMLFVLLIRVIDARS